MMQIDLRAEDYSGDIVRIRLLSLFQKPYIFKKQQKYNYSQRFIALSIQLP